MTGLRWQYLRVLMEQLPPIERLDELGSQGWEAVQKGMLPGQVTLYEWLFKRAVFEHPALVEGALEGVQRAQEQGTDGWPTLDELEQETRAEQQQSASPEPMLEAPQGQSESVKRARSPEHMAKMRAARWGRKPSPAPEEGALR